MTTSAKLKQAITEAAHTAGEVLRQRLTMPRQITEKGHLDLVTDADLASDKAIQNVIKAHYPQHEIVSEESEFAKSIADWQPDANTYYWVIDPIDGTTNFARGLPSWSLSIGVTKGSVLQAGAVYDVTRDDLFVAMKDNGVFRNDESVRVQATELQWALLGMDWPVPKDKRALAMACSGAILPYVRSQRTWGTTALALAHVGAGLLDVYMNMTQKPWDVAAGVLLVQEGGGRVTDLDGSPWHIKSPNLLASNGVLHDQILELIRPHVLQSNPK